MQVTIGALAKMADCQVVTVRYYEKEGLLGEPHRTSSNYRLYGDEDVERLKFIRHCRKHDMKLSEIRDLLSYRDDPKTDCSWVGDLIEAHIANVEQQMHSLAQLKATLQELRHTCSGHGSGDTCSIIKSLEDTVLCGCAQEHGSTE